eukprot:2475147-Rhodomonas_salina.1
MALDEMRERLGVAITVNQSDASPVPIGWHWHLHALRLAWPGVHPEDGDQMGHSAASAGALPQCTVTSPVTGSASASASVTVDMNWHCGPGVS